MRALVPIQVLMGHQLEAQANRILGVLSEFLNVNTLFVAVNDGTTNVIVASRNRSVVLAEPRDSAPLMDAYCRVVVEERQFVDIPNTAENDRTAAMPPTIQHGSLSFVGLPLVLRDGRVVGTLCGMDPDVMQLTSRQRILLDSMAEFLSYVFELEWQAYTDGLTGSGNRRLMDEWMDRVDTSGHKHVVFCDIDNLKELNDRWGHDVGDQAIRALAATLHEVFGAQGVVCRSGGDEFVVLLAEAHDEDVRAMAQQVHDGVACMAQLGIEGAMVGVTMGVAHTEDPHVTWRDAVRHADQIMLSAKREAKGSILWVGLS